MLDFLALGGAEDEKLKSSGFWQLINF